MSAYAVASSAAKVKTGVMTNEDVLRTEVSWTTYQAAGILTKEQLELIYTLVDDSSSTSSQVGLFKSNGPAFVELFVKVFTSINKVPRRRIRRPFLQPQPTPFFISCTASPFIAPCVPMLMASLAGRHHRLRARKARQDH